MFVLWVLEGCMFGPTDGQILATTNSTVSPWGAYPGANATVTFSARNVSTGAFQAVTSTTTTTGTYPAFGTSWNTWFAPTVTLPSWAWRVGVTGRRAEVRTTSGSNQLYSFPADGLECMLSMSDAGAGATEAAEVCGADTSPSAFLFTSDYRGMPTFTPQSPVDVPRELEHSRVIEMQGVATSSTHWYFAHNDSPQLVRIPLTSSLTTHGTWDAAAVAGMPSVLASQGYDHFGDPDEHGGFIYVPVEKRSKTLPGVIAQFDLSMNFRGYATLSDNDAPWVAVDPTTGLLYTSSGGCDVQTVQVYTMSFDASGTLVGLAYTDERTLWDRGGVPVEPLNRVQGGAFSDRGNLYLSVDGRFGDTCPVGIAGVFGFEAQTLHKEVYFDVPYDPGNGEELEGLDIRDLTNAGAPGIGGPLHLVMLDNDEWYQGTGTDDLYLKHYLAAAGELGFL
ncbi:MAG: hypothetical protein H6738_09680 [Alphaproteobacteria bacterium]|nr:hypothetical protein [Alphaproteobacteria bacterium]MCB9697035.1 hypothetical protein [Alphaproteobacteria bacterium]